jgi:nucleoside-diphosphate-sugar epimerase
MEKWCLERARSCDGTRVVVLNPSCVYGPHGQAYTALPARFTQSNEFCFIEGGRGIVNHCYIDNLVDAILLAAERREAHAQRFLITDGACSWREFLGPQLGEDRARALPSYTARELAAQPGRPKASVRELVGHLAGDLELIDIVNRMRGVRQIKHAVLRRAPLVRDSLIEMRPQTGGAAAVPQDAAPRYPPRWLADLYPPTRTRFSNAKAKQLLGWEPLVPLAEGQARANAWLRSARLLP